MNADTGPPAAEAAGAAEAQALARSRASFLANMSHEMRSPLAAIIGQCEQALRPDSAPGDWREALISVQRSAGHLLDLVNDVLDAAALESGQLRLDPGEMSLLPLCDEVLETLAPTARARDLNLRRAVEWPLPAAIETDRLRLKQVLLNLVSNAIKFTDQGEIVLRLRASREEGLLIAVEDTGVGIAGSRIEELLQPFAQGESSYARRHGGSGLGLYISHQLLLRMGGSLEASRRPAGGSRFCVRLPLPQVIHWIHAEPAGAAVAEMPAPLPALHGQVLLAEDDPILRRLLADMLAGIGLRVVLASNGAEALSLAFAHEIDLVLMDMHMPVVDGRTAARQMRERGYARPILAITADVLRESVAEHLASGCQLVLAKPITRQQLHATLGEWLPRAPTAQMRTAAEARLASVRKHFLQRLRRDGEALREELAGADVEGARERLHRIKGAASMFGMEALREACSEGETGLAAGAGAPALERFWIACSELLDE